MMSIEFLKVSKLFKTSEFIVSKVAAKLTKSTIEENKDLGKMDWEKVSKVVRCTVNADLEGNLITINLGVK